MDGLSREAERSGASKSIRPVADSILNDAPLALDTNQSATLLGAQIRTMDGFVLRRTASGSIEKP